MHYIYGKNFSGNFKSSWAWGIPKDTFLRPKNQYFLDLDLQDAHVSAFIGHF